MRHILVLTGLYISTASAVRLDISQEVDPAAIAAPFKENTVNIVRIDIHKYVIPAGLEKCQVYATGDKEFTSFRKKIRTLYYQKTNRWISKELAKESQTLALSWRQQALPYWVLQNGNDRTAHDISKFPYPEWDKAKVKFFFSLTQYDTDKTVLNAKFEKLPARRQYMIVIGTVEHARQSDKRSDEWKPKYACSGDTLLTYRYMVDIFRTGDDFTAWPLVDIPLGDFPIVGNVDSTVNSRSSEDVEIDGGLLSVLARTSDRKAFWILDATYMSYAGRVISFLGNDKPMDGDFVDGTFWSAIDNSWKDSDKQKDYFGDATKLQVIENVANNCDAVTDDATIAQCVKYSQDAFFSQYTWNSQVAPQALPVVACGLFNKVWPTKLCRKRKSESEARG